MNNPPPAILTLGDQTLASGRAHVETNSRSATFWPTDGRHLDTPYPQAMLTVEGMSEPIPVVDVHQCPASLIHWEMKLADQPS